jgi:hypothetical protein
MTELFIVIGGLALVVAVILTIGGSFIVLAKLCDKFL